jgi:hypothetical protein
VDAVVKKMLPPWTRAVAEGRPVRGPVDALPRRIRGDRTPDGVSTWLSFHGVEITRPEVTASGVWRSR